MAGPLSGTFPLVSLCTSKSDVVVGVQPEVAEDLDNRDKKWRVNGKSVSFPLSCFTLFDRLSQVRPGVIPSFFLVVFLPSSKNHISHPAG